MGILSMMLLGFVIPVNGTHVSLGVSVSDEITYEFTKTTTVLPNGTPVNYVLNYIIVENQNFPIPVEITVGSTMTIRIVDITNDNITHVEEYTWVLRNGTILHPKPLNFTRSVEELVPLNSALISTDVDLIINFLERQKDELARNSPDTTLAYEIRGDVLVVNFTTTNAFILSASSLYFEYDLNTGWNTKARLITTGNGDQLKSEVMLVAQNFSTSDQKSPSGLDSLINARISVELEITILVLGAVATVRLFWHRRVTLKINNEMT